MTKPDLTTREVTAMHTAARLRFQRYFLGRALSRKGVKHTVSTDLANVLKAVRYAKHAQAFDLCVRGALKVSGHVERHGRYSQGQEIYAYALTSLTPGHNDRAEVRLAFLLARTYVMQGQFAKATQFFRRSARVAARAGLAPALLIAKGGLASCLHQLGRTDQALQLLNGPHEKAAGQKALVQVYTTLSAIHFSRGDLPNTEAALDRGIELAKKYGSASSQTGLLATRSAVYIYTGRSEAAQKTLYEALRISREAGDVEHIALAHLNLGNVFASLGQMQYAFEQLEQSHQTALRHGQQSIACAALNGLGVCVQSIDPKDGSTRALQYWEDALKIADELGLLERQVMLVSNLASGAIATGNLDKALRLLKRARVLTRRYTGQWERASLQFEWGNYWLARGNTSAASAAFRRAQKAAGTFIEIVLDARLGIARVMLAQGRETDALHLAHQLLDEAQQTHPGKAIELANWVARPFITQSLPLPSG
jgi:tetratricopeptide (TPR) repeat protein